MHVEIVDPDVRLTANMRLHWRPRARIVREWRRAAKVAACGQLGRSPARRRRVPCFVRVEFPVRDPNRRRDPHNWAPTEKAIVDGLVDAGVWPDDAPAWVVMLPCRFVKATRHLALEPTKVRFFPQADGQPSLVD